MLDIIIEDIKVHPDSSRLDILAAVCEHASEIQEEEENYIVGKKRRKQKIVSMPHDINDRINELEKKVREVKFR